MEPENQNKVIEEEKEEPYSPYCKVCDGCGEDGCCTFTSCFANLVKNNEGCDYGERYVKDARFAKCIANLADDLIDKLSKGEMDKDTFLKEYDREWHEYYDKVYGK